ncbi:hypothetical protein ACI01nite_19110 [Acetobacter cibinongensis]|uniref:Phage integrase n=1 Tax=Acetobacter cibinongensis TaxID=146475 RepID=A0A0D6N1B8_9PROT|nr:DUF6538 domain-containing protein [Acetobacter cibinongensis]GAN59787.1 phage integrase [Acetobacter cibinongensis]GBQ14902.1 hypothetical protein AA0482_1058 [Acetobacter cibinongensis NRIC 0482]GEL59309.1 hypothetical protein ACI01nite_19110 [Acetobacter cibinongensis]
MKVRVPQFAPQVVEKHRYFVREEIFLQWENFMLRAIPSRRTGEPRYHFRRIVPALLRPLLGKTEISLVLHTSDKLIARERAAAL